MLIMAGVTSLGLLAAAWKLPETCPPAKRPARPRAVGQQVLALWSAARTLFGANPKARGVLVIYALVQFAGDGIVLSSITLLVTQRMGADIHVGGWVLGAASLGGALMAVRSVLALFSAPVAGRLSDGRLGRARLIALALGLGAVCFTVLALAQGLPALALGILLGALAGGGLAAGLPAYLGDCVGSEEQAVGLGAYATFGDAGSMLGPVVTLALAPLIGLTPVYLFAALIFVGGIVIIRPGRR
jgi:MFS family permease